MRCPYCGERETRVLDSRPVEIRIRRRRECSRCGKRFTTYEVVERPLLMVQKKDGSLEAFDRQKLLKGVFSAIKKRPVSAAQITSMIEEMETQYTSEMRSTVTSAEIGNTVMEKLKNIDAVAYKRGILYRNSRSPLLPVYPLGSLMLHRSDPVPDRSSYRIRYLVC